MSGDGGRRGPTSRTRAAGSSGEISAMSNVAGLEHGSVRRVWFATLAGTTLETYDFVLYGQAAAIVFGSVFFPRFSPASGTLAAFATFAVAFVARPVGAVLFGHYGDRTGRRSVLVASLLLSGGSTVAIGLLPGYSAIGVAAPVFLVVLRFMQGIGLGGEWSGSILLATEHAPTTRRGAYASFTQVGATAGPLLASAALLTASAVVHGQAFRSWGWRLPFLAGGVLVALGVYVRWRVSESPLFAARPADRGQATGGPAADAPPALPVVRLPVWEVLRRRPRMLLLACGGLLVVYLLAYTVNTFALSYGIGLGVSRTFMLSSVVVASVINVPIIPLVALLSDRVGRRPVCLAGAALAVVWSYPLLALIRTRSHVWVMVAVTGGVVIASLVFTPMGAYLPELFDTRFRYSGVSLSSNVAAVLGGGLAPIIATALLVGTGSPWSVTGYLAAVALLSLGCLLVLPETSHLDLSAPMGFSTPSRPQPR
jgi:MFS family permease